MLDRRLLPILAALAAFAAPARADDIPAYKVLSCGSDCLPSTPAKIITAVAPVFPGKYRGQSDIFVEALVDVDFTIGTDGTIKSAVVENLLGPQEFADAALAAIKARKYQPGTEGDTPVEENHRLRYMFRIRDGGRTARSDVASDYGQAIRLAKDGQGADALKILTGISAKPRLNLYERTMVAYTTALLEMQAGDNYGARDAIRIATIDNGSYLDPRNLANALRVRVHLEAMAGEFSEAFAWEDILRAKNLSKPGDAEDVLAAKLHETIAAPAPLGLEASLPPAGATPDFWQHTLLRRSFEFHNVVGALDRFELHCERHSILSPISEKANWNVPASWSGCVINVYGGPGAQFMFVEFQPAPAKP